MEVERNGTGRVVDVDFGARVQRGLMLRWMKVAGSSRAHSRHDEHGKQDTQRCRAHHGG